LGGLAVEKKNVLKSISDRIKNIKNAEIVALILVVALVLIMYPSLFSYANGSLESSGDTGQNESITIDGLPFEEREEERLERKLSVIDGAGMVEVLITYRAGKESIVAKHTVESSTDTEETDAEGGVRNVMQLSREIQPVIIDGREGREPMILKELTPEVKGVIVIAEGARDVRVRMELLRAVRTALGVNANQVEVFVMKQRNDKE
jgi:stage III sporulation protein AG